MKRVLVIDDDRTVRMLLKVILKKAGYDVVECANGKTSLKKAESFKPDLILLDLMLPDINGLQLLETFTSKENLKDVPIIVLTGSTDEENKLTALRSGAVDFITKPFLSEEVLLRVRTQLRIHSLIHSLQEAVEKLQDDVAAAAKIQKALVPVSTPQGFRDKVNWIYEPSYNVGGDIFDFIKLNDEKELIYLADVAGHGVKAAMLSVIFHRFVEDYVENIKNQGEKLELSKLIRALEDNFKFDKFDLFITTVAVVIDRKNMRIEIGNAGHPSPFFMKKKDRKTFFVNDPVESMLGLGLVEGKTKVLEINRGDRIYLFTDGVIEVVNSSGTQFGLENLKKNLEKNIWSKLEESVKDLFNEVKTYKNGEHFEDDVTIIGIEFTG